MRTVTGVFPSRAEAERVARDLEALGIPNEEVSIAGDDADRHDRKAGEWSRRNIAAAAASGFGWFIAGLVPLIAERTRAEASTVGATLGGIAGLVVGLVATMFRGAPISADGSLLTILLAVVVGVVGGGFAAEMYSSGVSHEGDALCEEAIREHGVVVSVHIAEVREAEAVQVMNEHHARKAHGDCDPWLASGWKGPHTADEPYPSDSSFVSHPPR